MGKKMTLQEAASTDIRRWAGQEQALTRAAEQEAKRAKKAAAPKKSARLRMTAAEARRDEMKP